MNKIQSPNRGIVKQGIALLLICALLLPALATPAVAQEEEMEPNPFLEMLMNHMNNREAWEAWLKENAFSLERLDASEEDDFADLAFLKELLEDQRIVMLGESSHGVKEFNSVKVRLIQYLHQELGFEVIAFESGWADAYAVNAQLGKLTGREIMEMSIYPVWHTEEVLPLFEYIREQAGTDHPLHLAGIDMQPLNAFSAYVAELFAEVDEQIAERWIQIEETFQYAVYSYSLTEEDLAQHRADWIAEYEAMNQFVSRHKKELAALRPEQPELISVLERAIAERKDILNNFVEAVVWLYNQDETTFAIPESMLQNFNYLRDYAMAEHLTWLAEEMYPEQKIIVWGHNYHLRKMNTAVENDPLFMGLPMPTVGELLPARLQAETYSIGLYMYQGENTSNLREIEQVLTDYDPNSIEAILKLAGKDNLFVDLRGQIPHVGNSWMFTPRQALYWGLYPETFIPRLQYDGLLWIDTVSPPAYVE